MLNRSELFAGMYSPAYLRALFTLTAIAYDRIHDESPEVRQAALGRWQELCSQVALVYNLALEMNVVPELLRLSQDSTAFDKVTHPIELVSVPVFSTALVFGLSDPSIYETIASHISGRYELPLEKEAEKSQSLALATVGRNNSGKGLVSDYLASKYGFLARPTSDRLREVAELLGYPPPHSRSTLKPIGKMIKAELGPGVLLHMATRILTEDTHTRLLFDGLREGSEAAAFVQLANQEKRMIVIGVTTDLDEEMDLKVRFLRAVERGGPKDPTAYTHEAFETFLNEDLAEAEGIEAARQYQQHSIINKGDVSLVYQQIDEIMVTLGVERL